MVLLFVESGQLLVGDLPGVVGGEDGVLVHNHDRGGAFRESGPCARSRAMVLSSSMTLLVRLRRSMPMTFFWIGLPSLYWV